MEFLANENHTTVTEFILLGLTDDPVLRVVLFMVILGIYLVTVSGNLSIVLLIRVSSQLHHPMYLFLSHLAFADICYSSSVTPNMLVNFLVERNTISYLGCGIQLGIVTFFGPVEAYLLAAMAYDRFVAICSPLSYSTKMSTQVCVWLFIVAYIGGFLTSFTYTLSFFSFVFCGSHTINHFFCDFAPLVKLSCSDVTIPIIAASFSFAFVLLVTLIVIAVSYIYILITILKMRSTEGPMEFLANENHTTVTEFILLGLTDDPVLRVVLFMVILGIYLVTVSGNLSIVLLIRVSSQLHHPMYLFLSHLAFADICYSSSVTPNMLVNFLVERNTISYLGCGIQLGIVTFFGPVEAYLLAAMAYDRFVAICSPLSYSTKMSTQVCVWLFIVAYIGGFLTSFTYTLSFFSFVFCGSHTINHFFCDFAPLVKLSCSDVTIPIIAASFSFAFVLLVTLIVIAVSYIYILITILKMRSTEGRHKAFSTCASHLTAVTLFYGTITFIYVMPKSSFSTDQNKVVSVFYMVVIPMLNPIIYSLRNNEIKGALKRELGRKIFS